MTVSHNNTRRGSPGRAESETQGVDTEFSEELKREITAAIQPTLDEFRQRMAQALSDQMAAMPVPGAAATDAGQTSRSAETPEDNSKTNPEANVEQVEGAPKHESVLQQAFIPVQNAKQTAERTLDSLPPAVQTLGRSFGDWLQSLLVMGLTALLAESTHAAVQQRAEQGLHALLQLAFDAAPDDFANQEIREKTERTLQSILRDTLGAVFAAGVSASLQQGGQQAIRQSLNGDSGGALEKIQEILQAVMTALVAELRRHQQTIVRLLIAFALLAMDYSLEHSNTSNTSPSTAGK